MKSNASSYSYLTASLRMTMPPLSSLCQNWLDALYDSEDEVSPTSSLSPARTMHTKELQAAAFQAGTRAHAALLYRHQHKDDADWRPHEIHWHRSNRWWEWDEGVINTDVIQQKWRYTRASEGTKLRNAVSAAERILRLHPCEFKFGMARLLGQCWLMYQDSDSDKWRPTHLFLLTEVCGREAAGYMEAALIGQFIDFGTDTELNINLQNNDYGGTGPRTEEFMHHMYFVYLACKVR